MRDDLSTIDHVRAWLKIESTTEDELLQLLLSGASRMILGNINRNSIFPRTVTEYYNGNNNSVMLLRNWPVLSVSAVGVNGIAIPVNATPPTGSGYGFDVWDGVSLPGQMAALWLSGYGFYGGRRNVSVTYTAGYRVTNEAATILSVAPYSVAPLQPLGTFGEDAGVTFANGTALTKVASAPAANQYAVDAESNGYIFAAADAGKAVLISYAFVPPDIEQACFEIVGEQYRYRGRIGEVSRALPGGGSVSFSQKAMSDTTKTLLSPYRTVIPI